MLPAATQLHEGPYDINEELCLGRALNLTFPLRLSGAKASRRDSERPTGAPESIGGWL